MLYLLDTSTLSDLMRGDVKARKRVESFSPEDRSGICAVVRGEILHGIERLPAGAKKSQLQAAAETWFGRLSCEDIPARAGDHYARLRCSCAARGLVLNDNDLWIASTALAIGAKLVTRDADFHRLSELDTEDWSVERDAT